MPDYIDQGQELAQLFADKSLADHNTRQRQKPKLAPFEVNGERFCLICADDISPERVATTDAVHCAVCEERLTRSEKHAR
jgi:hypothetical protein